MATTASGPSNEGGLFQGTITDLPVTAAADSVIVALKVPDGAHWLYFEVKNSHASVAFDEFKIKRRVHSAANYETLADAAGDYSSPQLPLVEVQGAPVTLAAAASTFIRMQVDGTESVQILASGAAAASTAELYYRFGD